MSLILSWRMLSLAVWVTDAVLPGVHLKSGASALLVATKALGSADMSAVGTIAEWLVRSV